jgi:hypothetical protein
VLTDDEEGNYCHIFLIELIFLVYLGENKISDKSNNWWSPALINV